MAGDRSSKNHGISENYEGKSTKFYLFIYLFIYCGSPKGLFEITFATFLILRSVSRFRNFPFIFSALPLDG